MSLQNQGTGLERAARSDEQGRYAFPQLPPSRYALTARQPGFVDVSVDGLEVRVNTTATVPVRFEKVGAVSETVSVTAEASQVNTTDASVGNAFNTRAVLQLPFNARNVTGLLSLQPGVSFLSDEPSSAAFQDRSNGTINGARSDQSNVTLDGVDVNDQQSRFAFTSVLRNTLDSVQEFRVTTTGINADQGRSAGAQVALVTKSGTNELHGSACWFHRNTITTANDFFGNRTGLPRPKLIRNIFGASLGGPIAKNRVFLFGNYEGRRDASEAVAVRRVPTADFRNGVVRYRTASGGVGTIGPEELRSRIDPLGLGQNRAMAALLNALPLPNDRTAGDGLNYEGFRFNASTPLRWNTYISRVDIRADDAGRHSLFLRGNLQNDNQVAAPQFPGQPPASANLTNSKGLAARYTAVFSPTWFASFRFGLTRQGVETTGVQTDNIFWPAVLIDTPVARTKGLSTIIPVYSSSVDFAKIQGAHTLQFGAVSRVIRNTRTSFLNSFHNFSTGTLLGGNATAVAAAPDVDLAQAGQLNLALIAQPGSMTRVISGYNYLIDGTLLPVGAPTIRKYGSEEYEFYLQDTWRASRGLTVTAGLRWSLMPPVYEVSGQQASVSPVLSDWMHLRGVLASQGRSQLEAGRVSFVAADSSGGRGLYPFHKRNLAPRLSVAYSPQTASGWLAKLTGGPGKTSLRAGGGLYYDLFGYGIMQRSDANSFGLTTRIDTPLNSYTLANAPRFTGLNDLPPGLIVPPPKGGPGTPGDIFTFSQSVDYGIVPPYSFNANFSIARELPHGFTVDLGYVGRLSRRTLVANNVAQTTDLRDNASGTTLYQGSAMLYDAALRNVAVTAMQPVAYWENLWPGAAGQGLTATQRMYQAYRSSFPDSGTFYRDIDHLCLPACSILGRNAATSPQFWTQEVWSSLGNGNYHSLQVVLRKRFSQGVQFDANYTWSKSIDLASGVERESIRRDVIANVWDRRQNRAVSSFDMTHQFNSNWVVELPVGRGKRFASNANAITQVMLAGWQVSGVLRLSTGLPVGPLAGGANSFSQETYATPNGTVPGVATTKNMAGRVGGGPGMFVDSQAAYRAFRHTSPGGAGLRNSIRTDGLFNIDLGIGKRFALPIENHGLQIRAEAFNLTNTPTFEALGYGPLSLFTPQTFGAYTRTLSTPRVLQFGLRYEF